MGAELGPHVQMRTLAERMATGYQMDTKLDLEPLVAHYMEEVEVNIASDRFDHSGFMSNIRGPLKIVATETSNPRRKEFLQAVVDALQSRLQQP
ncbi:hypothetical protein [Sinorhizobium sp. BG8]|uniref:hypothetical protein n=1 Tax=Sinorhizobium sp. BG8 TaxID=2613773 RepID=UPI00193D9CD7|nr:hypothetical protein [Sinorhizobium sp. BG8]QRM55235.1 hypothetical protein F3Y30_12330 [Sinorhizobium sp. BG8]